MVIIPPFQGGDTGSILVPLSFFFDILLVLTRNVYVPMLHYEVLPSLSFLFVTSCSLFFYVSTKEVDVIYCLLLSYIRSSSTSLSLFSSLVLEEFSSPKINASNFCPSK